MEKRAVVKAALIQAIQVMSEEDAMALYNVCAAHVENEEEYLEMLATSPVPAVREAKRAMEVVQRVVDCCDLAVAELASPEG
jgi:hypothetical protein